MSASTVRPFELALEVGPQHIDELEHVNNVVYLQWIQDAAIAHWRSAASAEAQAELLWVVVRHEVDYLRPAFLGDAIVARTWVGGSTRRDFIRHTEILRGADRKVLVKALTHWCPIDAKTLRPTDVSDVVRARFSASGD